MRSTLAVAVALTLSASLAGAVRGETRPDSGELRINQSTGTRHHGATVAFDPAGNRALVVWESSRHGLRARFVPTDGSAPGPEIGLAANTEVPSLPFFGEVTRHHQPRVGFLPGGGFLVAWTAQRDLMSADIFFEQRILLDQDVVVQRFTAAGAPVGAPQRVHDSSDGLQWRPVLGMRDGGAVVAWESNDLAEATADDGVFGRRISAAGAPVGEAFRVSPEGEPAGTAALATAADGGFAVAWEGPDGGTRGVFVQLYDQAAAAIGEPVRVNSRTAGLQRRPGITSDGNGGWLVVWQGQVGPRTESRIFGQFLNGAGGFVRRNFRVSDDAFKTRISPSVARLADGTYLALWLDWNKVFPVGVTAVVLDASGDRVGRELGVNLRPIDAHFQTALAVGPGGNAMAAWEGFATSQGRSGIQGRFFRTDE